MTTAEQFAQWGCSVEANGDHVIIQVGSEYVALLPSEAQRFAARLAVAYYNAGMPSVSPAGNLVIRDKPWGNFGADEARA